MAGVDLMAGVISKFAKNKNIHFLVAGDGPKRTLLEEVREKHNIQDRVTLLGAQEPSKVCRFVNEIQLEFGTVLNSNNQLSYL